MIIETASIGMVALASIGVTVLLIRKQAERDKRMSESLDRNTKVLDELKIFLVRLNGKLTK